MKGLVFFVSVLLITSAIKLNVSTSAQIDDLNNFFSLACVGQSGAVNYSFQGLPPGFQTIDSRLTYNGNVGLQGQFPVKITATDASGQSDSTIVLLNVNLSGTASIAYPNPNSVGIANAFLVQNSQNGGSSTSSTSSSTSSTSSGTGSSSSSTTSSSTSGSSSGVSQGNIGNSNGAQILTIDGVNYNLGNSITLNVGGSQTQSTSDIINQYSTTSITSSSTNRNVYPGARLPSGPVPSAASNNGNIIQITTAQASKLNGPNRNISTYDLNITQLFYQQSQYSQTIANLLEIIRQRTANKNKAQSDITAFTASLNSAISVHQTININITAQQNQVNQIKSAIDGANGLLNQLNANLTSIDNQIATAKVNGLALTQNLSIALNNKDGIQQQINITQTDINNINSNIGTQSKSCDQATQIISNLQLNVSNLQGSLIGLDQKVANIDSQIVNYNKQIDDLKKQIAQLQANIVKSQQDKQNLINLNYTVPQQIANLNAQITIQQGYCKNNGYSSGDLANAQNKLSQLNTQLTNANNNIVTINSNINLLKGQISGLLDQQAKLNLQISKTKNDLSTLKGQLPAAQSALSQLYISGNNAITAVNNANSSLIAATARYQQQSDALTLATINLEKARSDQQVINQQINVLLQQNTEALPFPIAPNSSGLLTSISSSNQIDSLSSYLLRAYGNGLTFTGLGKYNAVNILYNLADRNLNSNCPDAISLSSSTSTSSSDQSYQNLAGQGVISSTYGNIVTVKTSSGNQVIDIGECAIKLSNIKGYSPKIGDTLVWKGAYSKNPNSDGCTWDAKQVTFLA